jgi:hypothetical protein
MRPTEAQRFGARLTIHGGADHPAALGSGRIAVPDATPRTRNRGRRPSTRRSITVTNPKGTSCPGPGGSVVTASSRHQGRNTPWDHPRAHGERTHFDGHTTEWERWSPRLSRRLATPAQPGDRLNSDAMHLMPHQNERQDAPQSVKISPVTPIAHIMRAHQNRRSGPSLVSVLGPRGAKSVKRASRRTPSDPSKECTRRRPRGQVQASVLTRGKH